MFTMLVDPKADDKPHLCTGFRKVSALTVLDSKTKLVLASTLNPQGIRDFVTPDHFAQNTVMASGMRNAPATFQRLMNLVLDDVADCNIHLDDVVVYSIQWGDHLNTLFIFYLLP